MMHAGLTSISPRSVPGGAIDDGVLAEPAAGRQSATILAFPALRSWDGAREGAGPGTRLGEPENILFTMQDRIDLLQWSGGAHVGRMLVEPGERGAGPDRASYALIYVRDDPWSRWGITRSAAGVVTWCCRSGRDLSVTRTIIQALAALPYVRV